MTITLDGKHTEKDPKNMASKSNVKEIPVEQKSLEQVESLQVDQRYAELSDESLLLIYRESEDRKAFTALVGRYERELFNYLRRYTNDASLAEDAFQATFLQVHLKCHQFKEGAKLRPWLYTIATNQAIDALRKNKRHQMVSLDQSTGSDSDSGAAVLANIVTSENESPFRLVQKQEQNEWVRDTISKLPKHLRSVVLLAYYQGLKYREIAEMLDIPVGTVKSRLHAGIQKLSEAWKRSDFSEVD